MDHRKTLLDRAIDLAVDRHAGVTDMAGYPYILHPLRTMLRCEGIDAQIVAVLQDTIVDAALCPEMQRGGIFPDRIVDAFECLNNYYDESNTDYLTRVSQNPIARRAKIAKLTDMLENIRPESLPPHKRDRLKEYAETLRFLTDHT